MLRSGQTLPAFSLIIFDCDGVLVDSELLAIGTLVALMRRKGLKLSDAEGMMHFLGRSTAAVVQIARSLFGLDLSDDDLAVFRAELAARFRTDLRPIPWVARTLTKLSASMGYCVASSSDPDRIRLSLEVTGLLAPFEGRIFSATDVPRGKPSPDLFLYAAARCGVVAERCVVVEDSPLGVTAAHAAGMKVLGFTGGSHAGPAGLATTLREVRPTAIFDDMAALPGLLRKVVG